MSRSSNALLGVLIAFAATIVAAAEPIAIDSLMLQDPPLTVRVSPLQFSKKLLPLWKQALEHQEFDVQRQAALTIERAHREGMPGLKDAADLLLRTLDQADAPGYVRTAAARALIAIDARTSAPRLAGHLKAEDPDYALVVEPVLAAWDYQPVREIWVARLNAKSPRRLLVLALRGVGAVRDERAAGPLQKLVADASLPGGLRLEAAAALGRVRKTGLEDTARSLAAKTAPAGMVDRLAAIRLLGEHGSAAAVDILQGLARDAQPAVAGAALGRLLGIDPDHVLPHAEWGAAHADPRVRNVVGQALARRPGPERIRLLSTLLDDPHPDNRAEIREAMRQLAENNEHRPAVIESAVAMLQTDRWRGLEQSALLLAILDHEPAAPRLVELLDFHRAETFIAAAWGLRTLAVPETLAPMLDKARRETARRKRSGSDKSQDRQLALVFETFKLLKYSAAEEVLLEYVPKNGAMGELSRTSAIWTLGHLFEGRAPEALSAQFLARASDNNPFMPESSLVRAHSAIAIGRMGTKSLAANLEKIARESPDPVPIGCAWAVERLTGQKLILPDPPSRFAGGYFLEPLLTDEELGERPPAP